jgi:Pyrimidine dimer DNA glycosylase
LHPQYLDSRGLVALWREALLARAVLRGRTHGYRRHPQLARFRAHASPLSAINAYLAALHTEANRRGYCFDRSKIGPVRTHLPMYVASGQLQYEWQHLLAKLRRRDPALYRKWRRLTMPQAHPCFRVRRGGIAAWERLTSS